MKVLDNRLTKFGDDLKEELKIGDKCTIASAVFSMYSYQELKNQLNMDLTVLLYKSGYPPEWDEEVFDKVMEQAENFKKYNM